VGDEEDVVLSAIDSFCHAAAHGRFPDLSDADAVWRLLLRMTARKVCDYQRRNCREKRGGGKVRGESAFSNAGDSDEGGIEQVVGTEPSPDLVLEWMDTLRYLLGKLDDPALQKIAVLKLQGYSNREISDQMNCGLRSVERKLGGIRAIWSQAE